MRLMLGLKGNLKKLGATSGAETLQGIKPTCFKGGTDLLHGHVGFRIEMGNPTAASASTRILDVRQQMTRPTRAKNDLSKATESVDLAVPRSTCKSDIH